MGNLDLDASARGLFAHGMQGFDYERARADLGIPDSFDVMAVFGLENWDSWKACHRVCSNKIQSISNKIDLN